MSGVAVSSSEADPRRDGERDPPGVVLMLGAAVSWALGTVLLKRFELPIPTLPLTGWMMITGGRADRRGGPAAPRA